jgi:pyruvate formate lyase activating enzyme
MSEGLFYEKKGRDLVTCRLCPKLCVIKEGKTGFCRVRANRDGALYPTNYGRVAAYGLDPIEKKPLYHFYPGSLIMSLGATGCNLHCGFCQNWAISQGTPPTELLTPERAVDLARQARGNIGIAYTYSEPLVWYEFVRDTARLARLAGLQNVLVTNGYVNEEPLRELLDWIDAVNIDVKGFTEGFYKNNCAGSLQPVLRTVEIVAASSCHVELTNLLITGLNDSMAEIKKLVDWIAGLDRAIPLHFSRYYPCFEMDLPATPWATLRMAAATAKKKLSYVYLGNVPEQARQNTYCQHCGRLLIARNGYQIRLEGIRGKCCANCGEICHVVW